MHWLIGASEVTYPVLTLHVSHVHREKSAGRRENKVKASRERNSSCRMNEMWYHMPLFNDGTGGFTQGGLFFLGFHTAGYRNQFQTR